jgi:hypothetical protein
VFPDTATLCKTETAVIARASALAAAVEGEVRIIRRYVLWAVAAVFLFSGAGGAFAQAPQLTKQFGSYAGDWVTRSIRRRGEPAFR